MMQIQALSTKFEVKLNAYDIQVSQSTRYATLDGSGTKVPEEDKDDVSYG